MVIRKRYSTLLIFAGCSLLLLFGSLQLIPAAEAASPVNQTPSPQTTPVTATTNSAWRTLLERTPFAYTAPLPEPVPSPLDGIYAKIDPSWPQWWICRRCADYRPAGGIWRLQFEQGVMRLYYEITGWTSISSFTLANDRLSLFNDPYCPEDTGEYTWSITEGQLKLEAINDACAFGLRARNLSTHLWPVCLPPDATTEANNVQLPACAESLAIPAAPASTELPVTVNVYGGDSRFFETPPDILAFANGPIRAKREGIDLTFHSGSIPFGLNRILWWEGAWIEVSTERPVTAMGVQFMGDPYMGWARVLFDGVEVWRGDTAAIWSKLGRHGGYIEVSGFAPGPHTLRAESLNFDYQPVPVASFGFSEQGRIKNQTP